MLFLLNNSDPHKKIKLFIIFILHCIVCIETDLLISALPNIVNYFQINPAYVQKIFSINFIAIGIFSFIFGTISDFVGRKLMIIVSLVIFLCGGIVTAVSNNFNIFLLGRFVQGAGVGGVLSLGMAMLGDFFPGKRSIAIRNFINSLIPILMTIMPILGKFINESYGFRGICIVMVATAIISLVIILGLAHNLIPNFNKTLNIKTIVNNYTLIATNPWFWLLTIKISLLSAAYTAFNTQIGVLFMVQYQMSTKTFCYIQISILATYIVGNSIIDFLTKKFLMHHLKNYGIFLIIAGTSVLFISGLFQPSPKFIVLPMLVFIIGYTILQSIYFAELMEINPEKRGTIASIRTCTRLLVTTVVLELAAYNYNTTILPVATLELIIAMIVSLIHVYSNKHLRKMKFSYEQGIDPSNSQLSI